MPGHPVNSAIPCAIVAGVCLLLTGAHPVRADEPRSRGGVTLRGGSIAGATGLRGEEVTTVGVQLALGYQIGPIALEAEHERGVLLEDKVGTRRGSVARSAINLKLYALNLHRFASASVLRVYLEAGGGRNSGDLAAGEPFSRLDSSVGAGFLLDHRAVTSGSGGLRFAGWHLGWSLRGSEVAEMSPSYAARCKGKPCPAPEPSARPVDLSLIVSSSLSFNW